MSCHCTDDCVKLHPPYENPSTHMVEITHVCEIGASRWIGPGMR